MMRTEPPRNTGTDGDGVAQSEADHFQKCPVCSQWFDMRDLAQVAEHIAPVIFQSYLKTDSCI
jgi:hypothetical protein